MVLLLSSSWSDFVAFACAGGRGGRAPSQAAKWKELDSSPSSSFLSVPTRLKVKVVPGGVGSGEESSHNRASSPSYAGGGGSNTGRYGRRKVQAVGSRNKMAGTGREGGGGGGGGETLT